MFFTAAHMKAVAREPPLKCRIMVRNIKENGYNPGDTISGSLLVTHQDDVVCLGIWMALEGKALVKFNRMGVVESKVEDVVLEEKYVFGHGISKVRLAPRSHSFPFSFRFPMKSPSSFNGQFGLITYQVLAYLHSEWRSTKKAEQTVSVNGTLDLNSHPSALIPVSYSKCFKYPRSRPSLLFNFTMDQSGYVPGEKMRFTLEVRNPDGQEIDVRLMLMQKHVYRAAGETKITRSILNCVRRRSTDPVKVATWTGSFRIPLGLVPTQFGSQINIIDLQYALQILINDPEQTQILRGEIPIIIGTIAANNRQELVITSESSSSRYPRLSETREYHRGRSMEQSRSAAMDLAGFEMLRYGSHPDFSDLAPSYSQLSLTRSSSMETLPPSYQEAVTLLKNEDYLANTLSASPRP